MWEHWKAHVARLKHPASNCCLREEQINSLLKLCTWPYRSSLFSWQIGREGKTNYAPIPLLTEFVPRWLNSLCPDQSFHQRTLFHSWRHFPQEFNVSMSQSSAWATKDVQYILVAESAVPHGPWPPRSLCPHLFRVGVAACLDAIGHYRTSIYILITGFKTKQKR